MQLRSYSENRNKNSEFRGGGLRLSLNLSRGANVTPAPSVFAPESMQPVNVANVNLIKSEIFRDKKSSLVP